MKNNLIELYHIQFVSSHDQFTQKKTLQVFWYENLSHLKTFIFLPGVPFTNMD